MANSAASGVLSAGINSGLALVCGLNFGLRIGKADKNVMCLFVCVCAVRRSSVHFWGTDLRDYGAGSQPSWWQIWQ